MLPERSNQYLVEMVEKLMVDVEKGYAVADPSTRQRVEGPYRQLQSAVRDATFSDQPSTDQTRICMEKFTEVCMLFMRDDLFIANHPNEKQFINRAFLVIDPYLYNAPFKTKSVGAGASPNREGCYVATAVYGAYDCPEVWTLRRYRDYTLSNTRYGRAFIHIYYAVSPTIVKLFGDTKWFNSACRARLDSLIRKLQKEGYSDLPYADKEW